VLDRVGRNSGQGHGARDLDSIRCVVFCHDCRSNAADASRVWMRQSRPMMALQNRI
jgi:hypothetical protein